MPLLEHQTVVCRCLRASDHEALTALTESVHGCTIDHEELEQLQELVLSSGFRFTRHVQRSWCRGRSAEAAQLTLSLLPIERQRQLVGDWVDAGGGRALDPASEAVAFLEFVAHRLTDPSHALTVCRMQQAAYRASEVVLRFRPPDPSLLDDPQAILRAGSGAALVRFLTEPQRLFAAIQAKEPLPPLSEPHFPVLFAPGLPALYRAATNDEEAIWENLVSAAAVRVQALDPHLRHTIDGLFRVGAAELMGS
jgi:hypothetical protein